MNHPKIGFHVAANCGGCGGIESYWQALDAAGTHYLSQHSHKLIVRFRVLRCIAMATKKLKILRPIGTSARQWHDVIYFIAMTYLSTAARTKQMIGAHTALLYKQGFNISMGKEARRVLLDRLSPGLYSAVLLRVVYAPLSTLDDTLRPVVCLIPSTVGYLLFFIGYTVPSASFSHSLWILPPVFLMPDVDSVFVCLMIFAILGSHPVSVSRVIFSAVTSFTLQASRTPRRSIIAGAKLIQRLLNIALSANLCAWHQKISCGKPQEIAYTVSCDRPNRSPRSGMFTASPEHVRFLNFNPFNPNKLEHKFHTGAI
jgi:hypothetical protein